MASFGRNSWWEEVLDREGVRTLSFCYWQTLRLWTSHFMHVGLSFFIHKIRAMVPLSRSEDMILVFTQLGWEMYPDSCLWKSSLQAVLPPEGWQAQGCPLPCSALWEPPAEPLTGQGPHLLQKEALLTAEAQLCEPEVTLHPPSLHGSGDLHCLHNYLSFWCLDATH